MADWEELPLDNKIVQSQSPWEEAPVLPSQRMYSDETLGESLGKAPFRIGEDITKGLFHFLSNVPQYYQASKSQVPGAINTMIQHPGHALRQGIAGLAEMGQNTFNTPHDIANYATNRLNLLPTNINEKIQMGRMPDSQQDINATFGKPQYPGEELIRGAVRNSNTILAVQNFARALNPMKYTPTKVANRVLQEGDRQIGLHNKLYDALWKDADQAGIKHVPYNLNTLQNDFNVISKYKTPSEYESIVKFSKDPTLPNAQTALIDIRKMQRGLAEKAKKDTLTGEQKALENSLNSTEQHIESNMFKDRNGNVNKDLLNKYKVINNSYRENVVPYKYNDALQAYKDALPKNKSKIAKQTIDSLKNDIEFIGKKGHQHPELYRAAALKKLLGTGVIGATGAAGYQYIKGSN